MAVKSADMADKKGPIPAHQIYKDIGMSLKDFKAICAELGIVVKGAVSRLNEDEVHRIRTKLGINEEPAVEEEAAPVEDGPSEEERKKAEAAAAKKKAEEDEEFKAQKAIADKLGVEPDQVSLVGQLLGVELESDDDVDESLATRANNLQIIFNLSKEFEVPPREVSRTARSLGLEVGRKNFKGLSPNEEFMLRAMVKQKHTTEEERRAEVEVEKEEEYKPAPPTGNKAVEEKKQPATTKKDRRGRVTNEQTREVIPERFRQQQGGTGRGRRERFEVSQLSYDRPRGGRRGRRDRRSELLDENKPAEMPTGPVTVELPVNMRQLSEAMGVKTSEIMRRMITEGLPPMRINDTLGKEIIEQIGILFEREITAKEPKDAEDLIQEQLEQFDENAGHEEARAPIVTIMGHVDHGKTSLLDAIAKLDRVSEESGGITQHIGAFRLDLLEKDGEFKPVVKESDVGADDTRLRVTFIDTPGHEAFTEMRARGANVTDIAVIVVAADDGVMPQTEEAISHARAAEVEIVIAITKIDKPEANLAKVRQQLATHNLMAPDWGGTTEIVELSSITGEGVDKLVKVLSDYSELLELTAIPDKPAVGTVLEAHRDPGRGIVATMLVKAGRLRRGDVIVAGHGYGRVRAMQEPRGAGLFPIEEAGPSIPVEVAGLDEMPEAGSLFHGMKDLKKAAEIANMVRQQELDIERSQGFSLEEWSKARAGQAVKELVIVLKCDVQGTAETIKSELAKLTHDEVRIKVIHSAVGQISTTDVHLAEAAGGIVIGFHVGVDAKARELADNHHVDVRTYEVIYKLIEELRDALGGMLAPELVEVYQGTAEIRKVFRVTKVGNVAGCMVIKGFVKRDSKIRLVRDGLPIYETDIVSLKREKDDAAEVREGFECGIQIKGYDDIKEGDLLEAFRIEEHKRSLDS